MHKRIIAVAIIITAFSLIYTNILLSSEKEAETNTPDTQKIISVGSVRDVLPTAGYMKYDDPELIYPLIKRTASPTEIASKTQYQDINPGVPEEIWNEAVLQGEIYNIAPELISAMTYVETRYQNINSKNGKYLGPMQINPRWQKERMERLNCDDLTDLPQNIQVGTDYLSTLLEEYEDVGAALMHYNGSSAEKICSYMQTGKMSKYAKDVLDKSAELERTRESLYRKAE